MLAEIFLWSAEKQNWSSIWGYWCCRAGHSWLVGMKTLCVRRKSITQGSVGRQAPQQHVTLKLTKPGNHDRRKQRKAQGCSCRLSPIGSYPLESSLIVSRRCSKIFSGVPDMTVYLHETQKKGREELYLSYLPSISKVYTKSEAVSLMFTFYIAFIYCKCKMLQISLKKYLDSILPPLCIHGL